MRRIVYGVGASDGVGLSSTAVMADGWRACPEISGGSLSMGFGLLAGGILMLRARFGKEIVRGSVVLAAFAKVKAPKAPGGWGGRCGPGSEGGCMRRIVYGAGFLQVVLASLSTAVMAGAPPGVPEYSAAAVFPWGLVLLVGGIVRRERASAGGSPIRPSRQCSDVGDRRARSHRLRRPSRSYASVGMVPEVSASLSFGRSGDPHGWHSDPAGADAS